MSAFCVSGHPSARPCITRRNNTVIVPEEGGEHEPAGEMRVRDQFLFMGKSFIWSWIAATWSFQKQGLCYQWGLESFLVSFHYLKSRWIWLSALTFCEKSWKKEKNVYRERWGEKEPLAKLMTNPWWHPFQWIMSLGPCTREGGAAACEPTLPRPSMNGEKPIWMFTTRWWMSMLPLTSSVMNHSSKLRCHNGVKPSSNNCQSDISCFSSFRRGWMKRGNKVNVRPFYHKRRKLRRAERALRKETVLCHYQQVK